MTPAAAIEVSYFPGCSLATTARESNQSLVESCAAMGVRLVELEDWNCCGSSSAHSLNQNLALGLTARILTLSPPGRPLLTMCPSCFKNLRTTQIKLRQDEALRLRQEKEWGAPVNQDVEVVGFFELLHFLDRLQAMGAAPAPSAVRLLSGLKIATYYGCMAMLPPALRRLKLPWHQLEIKLGEMGAEVVPWAMGHRCCGAFISATHPPLASGLINGIFNNALEFGAECLVTACAMCQLNLEIRCTLKGSIPTFHFSELMALVLGAQDYEPWFRRHLVDPRPLLRGKGLIA